MKGNQTALRYNATDWLRCHESKWKKRKQNLTMKRRKKCDALFLSSKSNRICQSTINSSWKTFENRFSLSLSLFRRVCVSLALACCLFRCWSCCCCRRWVCCIRALLCKKKSCARALRATRHRYFVCVLLFTRCVYKCMYINDWRPWNG